MGEGGGTYDIVKHHVRSHYVYLVRINWWYRGCNFCLTSELYNEERNNKMLMRNYMYFVWLDPFLWIGCSSHRVVICLQRNVSYQKKKSLRHWKYKTLPWFAKVFKAGHEHRLSSLLGATYSGHIPPKPGCPSGTTWPCFFFGVMTLIMVRLASHANNTISWMILNKIFMRDLDRCIVRSRRREHYFMGTRKEIGAWYNGNRRMGDYIGERENRWNNNITQ